MKIKERLCTTSALIHENLREILHAFPSEEKLFDAIKYSLLAESSCIRGFLVLEFGKFFNVPYLDALEVASAIEMIHSFSLIHDDLPALDNSNERRNQPACHVAFPESTAILAGDALLVLAYQLLSHYGANLIQDASKFVLEMIVGQVHDLKAEPTVNTDEVNRMKTGALFALSCSSAGYLAKIETEKLNILKAFGYEIGLIFQAADNIKDGDTDGNPQEGIKTSLKKSREMLGSTFLVEKRPLFEEFLAFISHDSL